MTNKLKVIVDIFRQDGPHGLIHILRQRAARVLAGNTLSNRFSIMAYYLHADGERIPLYAGYRDYLKPLHFLAHADAKGYQLYLRDNSESFILASGLGGACKFYSFVVNDLGIDIKGKKILDVGCGDGALAYVLAANGASEVHGIDVDFSYKKFSPQHNDIIIKGIERLFGIDGINSMNLVKIYPLNIQNPALDDRFDLILSNSVLEHIVDLRSGLAAMREMLNRNGVMIHRFNPFFSETGGHEYCILDFPWGHVRLSSGEIAEYLETYRAWEKELALKVLYQSFYDPKLTLAEIDDFVEKLGLKAVYASERRGLSWKLDSTPARILSQCRRNYPLIDWKDLTSDTVVRVWRNS